MKSRLDEIVCGGFVQRFLGLFADGARVHAARQVLLQTELVLGGFPVDWIIEVHRRGVPVHVVLIDEVSGRKEQDDYDRGDRDRNYGHHSGVVLHHVWLDDGSIGAISHRGLVFPAKPSNVLERRVQFISVDVTVAPVRSTNVSHLVHKQGLEHIEPLPVFPVAVFDGSLFVVLKVDVCGVILRGLCRVFVFMVCFDCRRCGRLWFVIRR